MTVFLVTSGVQTTLFTDRETAEKSITRTREKLVGGGYLGNLKATIDEVHVHDSPFDVR